MKKNKIENAETPALPQGAVTGLAAKGAAVKSKNKNYDYKTDIRIF